MGFWLQKRSRHSETVWIGARDAAVVTTLQRRLGGLTKLPQAVLHNSGTMQVVKYGQEGQYTLHLDSGTAPQPRSGRSGAGKQAPVSSFVI